MAATQVRVRYYEEDSSLSPRLEVMKRVVNFMERKCGSEVMRNSTGWQADGTASHRSIEARHACPFDCLNVAVNEKPTHTLSVKPCVSGGEVIHWWSCHTVVKS